MIDFRLHSELEDAVRTKLMATMIDTGNGTVRDKAGNSFIAGTVSQDRNSDSITAVGYWL